MKHELLTAYFKSENYNAILRSNGYYDVRFGRLTYFIKIVDNAIVDIQID